ncbi:MAG: GIY-YIG nuclease family protein [Planctomycetota bacterium]
MEATSNHAPSVFDFGVNPLDPFPRRRVDWVTSSVRDQLRERVRTSCPNVPGVYGMVDRRGDLIYVGKSKQLRSRLLSYFADSNAENKGGRIITGARTIQWETQPSEFASLLREQQLIRRLTPRFNVQGVPKRQRPVYLCLGRRPATFFIAAKPPTGAMIAVEGPFYGAGRMTQAAELLNKTFRLRDCANKQVFHFAEQLSLFEMDYRPGCLRLETGTCLGPCAAACTRAEYDVAVNAAESFMDGFNHEPIVLTQDSFERAMENRQYELAGRLHASMKALEYVDRKLSMLATARRTHSFVYDVAGFDGRRIWYLIQSGEVVDVLAPSKTGSLDKDSQAKLRLWKKRLKNRLGRGQGPHPHTLSIVAAWFRKHRDELQRTFQPTARGTAPTKVA